VRRELPAGGAHDPQAAAENQSDRRQSLVPDDVRGDAKDDLDGPDGLRNVRAYTRSTGSPWLSMEARPMGDKSARKSSSKTPASKTLKEKRLDKADKKARVLRAENVDALGSAKKR
jgi:hypothetical protein